MLAPNYPEWIFKIRKAKNTDVDSIVEAVESAHLLMGGGENEFTVFSPEERRVTLLEATNLQAELARRGFKAEFAPCDCEDCKRDYEARQRANHFVR